MVSASLSDLTQVAALFEACIEQIRSKPERSLDKEAEEWLEYARVAVMKDTVRRRVLFFSDLAKNADDPSLTPVWVTNPSIPLTIFPPPHSRRLDSYVPLFEKEFGHLMKQCGFTAIIYFPAGSTPQRSTKHFMDCFDLLPEFSAAVLKITEGIEKPVLPPDVPSTLVERTSSFSVAKETRKNLRQSGRRREPELRDSENISSARRTSKRLRNSVPMPDTEEIPDKVGTPRRTKRLRGL
ncbi:hypothetical protein H2248_008148 [Termitomyces sp. 'cryptogamus']|nr:hypothetical protein H2248_008148 [Termitomyces sp. 'cryptogamus']